MDETVSLLSGLLLWFLVLRDGFFTIIHPRAVAPLDGLSGYFYHFSWRGWSAVARRMPLRHRRLHFLAVYGPLSVVSLLAIWAVLTILAFALIYRGVGANFNDDGQQADDLVTLIYMSGSTFLTLGLGDVTPQSLLGRFFMIVEAGNGLIFLSLIVTYMPILDSAYAQRETENLKIQTRTARPQCAAQVLRVYLGTGEGDTLRISLHDAENWFAGILESHIAHPVVAYYRAQRLNSSWLNSFALIMDTCAVLIAAGDVPASRQARATFRMGLRVLHDLMTTLSVRIDPDQIPQRMTLADLDPLVADLESISPRLALGPEGRDQLLRLSHLYDVRLTSLAAWTVVDIPGWLPPDPSSPPEPPAPWEHF